MGSAGRQSTLLQTDTMCLEILAMSAESAFLLFTLFTMHSFLFIDFLSAFNKRPPPRVRSLGHYPSTQGLRPGFDQTALLCLEENPQLGAGGGVLSR